MNTIFKKLRLSDYALPEDYQVKPLTYSGIPGKADVMGCYIIVFRTTFKSDETAAISFDDMLEDSFVKTVGNDMLKRLGIQAKFGYGIDAIKNVLGEPFAINEISEDMARYYYLNEKSKTFMDFGVSKKYGLFSLEITDDAEIIKQRKQRLQLYHTA